MHTRILRSFVTSSSRYDRGSGRVQSSSRGIFVCLITLTALITVFSSAAFGGLFSDVSAQAGLVLEKKKSWGNPIWGDFNNDGFLDFIVPCHGLLLSRGPFVYLNNGDGTFTDVRSTCGIHRNNPDSGDWHGFSFGDFDGDGNLDVYVSEGSKQGTKLKCDELFRGLGNGTFQYDSRPTGIEISVNRGRCGTWVDYDNDGKLDLFVKNFDSVNRLYKNNGDGTFTQVAEQAGLADVSYGLDYGSICSFADYDNDGFMDLAITGDKDTEVLYRNQGDGTFVDVTAASGLGSHTNDKGLAWGDYNNDGFMDLCVVRGNEGGVGELGVTLYRNNGDGTFTDVTTAAGMADTGNDWAPVWGDYDNDGFLDLFVTKAGATVLGSGNGNLLYHNNGDGTFTNRAAQEGVQLQDNTSLHRGAAWADYNNDGFLDLMIKEGVGAEKDNGENALGLHRLFKNRGNHNHFIKVNLKGVQSNIRGLGARVTVTYTGGLAYRQNNGDAGGQYASQSSVPLHLGIGTATNATVEVKWPSGVVDTLTSVAANSTLTIVENTSGAPTITKQPQNRTVTVGETARFVVVATGTEPLSYQWRKNGTEIPGATDSSYVTPPTTLADDGTIFDVIVSNTAGQVKSRNAKLRVIAVH